MQPYIKEMQTLNSIQPQFNDDFFDQMLSNSWPPELSSSAANQNPIFTTLKPSDFSADQIYQNFDDQPAMLTTKFQQHQIRDNLPSLYNEFTGSLNNPQILLQSQPPKFGAAAPPPPPPAQPKQRVRARRGQATDPHSIAERLRRERIAERMKALQELVPNANKTDKASMLDEIIDYVKFLQLQVKVLSMSRLGGGAAAVTPLVTDLPSQGGVDCIKRTSNGINGPQTGPSSSNDAITATEQQVAKLMEEDMGSAMQYLQGKGLCLMPISLATSISTVTGHIQPPSPNMSVLTVQSINGLTESVSKRA